MATAIHRLAQCCRAAECARAAECPKSTAHAVTPACNSSSTCYDAQPYVDGGVRVWCDLVEKPKERAMAKKTKRPDNISMALDRAKAQANAGAGQEPNQATSPKPHNSGVVDEIRELPVDLVDPNPANPRQIQEDSPKFKELLESVKASGVKLHVMVCPHPTKSGHYHLISGGRRLRAAQLANRATIPAIVKHGLTEQEAFDLCFFENWGREDLTPLEEAAAVRILMVRHGGNAQAVADILGKPPRWVVMRDRMNDLAPEWRRLAETDGRVSQWTASMLALIARYPESEQKLLASSDASFCRTAGDLERWLDEHDRKLSAAPWKLGAPDIAGAPACNDCPNRSDRQPLLWEDAESVKGAPSRCLDSSCWARKLEAALASKAASMTAECGKAVLISDGRTDIPDAVIEAAHGAKVLSSWYVNPVKKSTPGAIPALYASGPQAGRRTWILPPDHKEAYAKPSRTMAQKKDALNRKRWAEVNRRILERVESAVMQEWGPARVLNLIGLFGCEAAMCVNDILDGLKIELQRGGDEPVAPLSAREGLAVMIHRRLRVNGPATQMEDFRIGLTKAMASLCGEDPDAIFREVSESKGFREPASWTKRNASETTEDTESTGVR